MSNLDKTLKILTYYHTSLRNVGLYTTISFGALGYSRFYRGKSKLYSVGMIIISLVFLLIASLLNILLYNTIQEYINKEEYKHIEKWVVVNKIMLILHTLLIFFAGYTLFRLYTGNKFD